MTAKRKLNEVQFSYQMCYEWLNIIEAGEKMVHVMEMVLVQSNVYGWSEKWWSVRK